MIATPLADPRLVAWLRRETPAMVEALGALVSAESPSSHPAATRACVEVLSQVGRSLLGCAAEAVEIDGCPHVRWRFGSPTRVLLLGHADTVWPLGTLTRWPFSVDGDRASGPGIFDMKAGLVQGLFALAAQDDLDGVSLLVTADEELGSPTSRALVEESAGGADAVLVLEPSARGALKAARKGVSLYRVEVTGRAAHAGLEPHEGVNALVEAARQVLAVSELADNGAGTTVSPTVAKAGTATNVIPAAASFDVDVRVASAAEQARVDAGMRALAPVIPGGAVRVSGGPNRPPLPEDVSAPLLARARSLAGALGLPPLDAAAVGGASDGNFTAGIGVPTLDGLGAVGGGAHAEGEHVLVPLMPERAALVAALVDDLRRDFVG